MPRAQLRMLLDTNVFIEAESEVHNPHPKARAAAELLRLAAELGHSICLAHGIHEDFQRHADPQHRLRRSWQLQRYHVLDAIPVPDDFRQRSGYPPTVGPSGWVDMTLLLALERGAAQWLVTDDGGLHVHAQALGLADRTLTLTDAVELLRRQLTQPIAVPAVEEIKGFQLDTSDPIFDDFDASYGVRTWITEKVAPEHRPCLTMGSPGHLDSVVILNEEHDQTWGLTGNVLKICTFKVAPAARGVKRGELLLWAIMQYARNNHFDEVFIEVFEHEEALIALLESFGFHDLHIAMKRAGERAYAKHLRVRDGDPLAPLDHHIAYGPGALRVDRAFVVPILPHWHSSLFPVADEQLTLALGVTDQGNAIRKAYLSNSNSRLLRPGDTMLFLRTRVDPQVNAIGIVEDTLVSADPVEILQFTGRRTVYTPDEVVGMCAQRPVLAIRFRLDRVLDTPLTRAELIEHGVMRQSPMSLMQIRNPGALTWLKDLLAD